MFSEILRDLRAKKCLSQKQLAEVVRVSPGNVSDWESGKTKPGYTALAALSRCFGVSADYLLELTPGKPGDVDDEFCRLDEIKRVQGHICDGSPLDNMEADLIAMLRLLPFEEQEDVFDIVHLKYKRRVEKKKESIFWTYFDGSDDKESGPAEGHKTHGETA